MGRSTGKRTRAVQKKTKVKISKRTQAAFGKKKAKSTAETATKRRSVLLKKQAQERMVLKAHMCQLKQRRAKTVRGKEAKQERREMGKYIRQLAKEQGTKHKSERLAAEKDVAEEDGYAAPDEDAAVGASAGAGESALSEAELRTMFSNLLQK